jgi:hypothetical protein
MDDMLVSQNDDDVDSNKLPTSLLIKNGYDGVVLANLLCRLPNPMACLEMLPSLVKRPGSIVLILTPYTWLEEFTPRKNWLGGYYDNKKSTTTEEEDKTTEDTAGVKIWSKDTLRTTMEKLGFIQIHCSEMPFVIREHQRKYQYCISEATGWKKL